MAENTKPYADLDDLAETRVVRDVEFDDRILKISFCPYAISVEEDREARRVANDAPDSDYEGDYMPHVLERLKLKVGKAATDPKAPPMTAKEIREKMGAAHFFRIYRVVIEAMRPNQTNGAS